MIPGPSRSRALLNLSGGMMQPPSTPLARKTSHILLALTLLLMLCGCGRLEGVTGKLKPKKPVRPCFDHEECFAGEYCAEGSCRPYEGTTTGRPRPQLDLSAYDYDLGAEEDLGEEADMP